MNSLKRSLTGRRRTVAAVLAATVLLGGAGAATAVAFADDGSHDSSRDSTHAAVGTTYEDRDDGTFATKTKIDLKQAADAAVASVAGKVTSVELEGHQGKAVWKVDVASAKGAEHEVTVNATSGRVTAHRTDHDDADDEAALARSARTGLGQAVDAALKKIPGTATSAELDDDNGRSAAWHIDVTDAKGAEHEVTVDARSGKVTAVQADDDHDDHDRSGDNDRGDDREED
ncbi:Propeptide PepSY amd peptidase M4 [Streptomyces bingchenggensis BCW-1]|uniref:Propeptide PepSY amd peptidase M4 n=1 Tax=Streptomyces bingchenggensis (strain BCW-1) TaxID=749414 RepID=D7C7E7_STRBB|nr:MULTISPECIES: PepSY domain-containing protein [Streptomyces]ADI10501.1 Propeptide PepSY amd peptidase M4 [Streptomyces bingchenggensis BCW-1]